VSTGSLNSFDRFSRTCAPNWQMLREYYDDPATEHFLTKSSNPIPLVRLARDYFFWRWFEIEHIVDAVDDLLRSNRHQERFQVPLFGKLRFDYIAKICSPQNIVLIAGP